MLFDEDDISDGEVLGYFAFYMNGNEFGDYHDNPSLDDVWSTELLTYWFTNLIMAYQELCRSGYVALDVLGSFNSWIEFKKVQDNMAQISVIRAEKEDGTMSLRLTPFKDFEYGEWYNQIVKLVTFTKGHFLFTCKKPESAKNTAFAGFLE